MNTKTSKFTLLGWEILANRRFLHVKNFYVWMMFTRARCWNMYNLLTGMMTRAVVGIRRFCRFPTFYLKAFLQNVVKFVKLQFNNLELKTKGRNWRGWCGRLGYLLIVVVFKVSSLEFFCWFINHLIFWRFTQILTISFIPWGYFRCCIFRWCYLWLWFRFFLWFRWFLWFRCVSSCWLFGGFCSLIRLWPWIIFL